MNVITVYKHDHLGNPVWHYEGKIIQRTDHMIQLEAFFNRDDYDAGYHRFKRGDRMVEWFFSDRWYNVFQMHDAEDDHLKGWYCNITRPATFDAHAIRADDLALDLMVYPDGCTLTLDEDEFRALDLPKPDQTHARAALDALKQLVAARAEFFTAIRP